MFPCVGVCALLMSLGPWLIRAEPTFGHVKSYHNRVMLNVKSLSLQKIKNNMIFKITINSNGNFKSHVN
jgi:hypothetical protein